MNSNPFVSESWIAFWQRLEQEWAEEEKRQDIYGPTECDFCNDWYNCPDCPLRLEQEEKDAAEEALESYNDY